VGIDPEIVDALQREMIPILEKYGVNHENKTFVPLPPGRVYDPVGTLVGDGAQALYIPAFDALRTGGGLGSFLSELSHLLGMPVHTIDAAVLAAINGRIL